MSEQRYDVVIKSYKSKVPDTRHDDVNFEQVTGIAKAMTAAVLCADHADETGFSFMIRKAKPTVYEVWRSADIGEIKETTFTSLDNAVKHADDMQAAEDERAKKNKFMAYGERDGYYIKRRWGRAKAEIVYRAKRG